MAFAEALEIARGKDVDFILLGGDLFHMNKPNAMIEHKCIKIIRQHMNANANKKTTFRRIAGEFSHFERVKHGNFEDPSLSVPYPIFTIHGNHDDPTGPTGKSVCEKLATCGLLNYFGKVKQIANDKQILVRPIILEKEHIKIALYGLGFIPDKKLCSAFKSNYVSFEEPRKDTFNILVVHQNRRKYDEDKFIPDNLFPKWFHLIIRGHEHDALKPEIIPESKVGGLVYQPGSTVATSIEVRESAAKQVGLMSVVINDPEGDESRRYKLNYEIIDLKCYRKMLFKDIYQKEVFKYIKQSDSRKKLTPVEYRNMFREYVTKQIDDLIEAENTKSSEVLEESQETCEFNDAALEKLEGTINSSVYAKLFRFNMPILRVRLEFVSKSEIFEDRTVNNMFYPIHVANEDIIKFRKQKTVSHPDGTNTNLTFSEENANSDYEEDEIGEVETIDLKEERKDTVDTMILNYFNNKPVSQRLEAISLDEYTTAVKNANEDGNVISKVLTNKKNLVLNNYKTALKNEETASTYFNLENKIHDWFMDSFQGKQPKLFGKEDNEPSADWDDDDMDDENDDIIVLE